MAEDKIHVVKPGDRMSKIAHENGYGDPATIWRDAANAELEKRRPNPEILMPGDRVVLPPKKPGPQKAPAEAKTKLAVKKPQSRLRVQLTFGGLPFEGKVTLEGLNPDEPDTSAETEIVGGWLDIHVRPSVTEVIVRCADPVFALELRVGYLQPVDEPIGAGVEQRLNNLGYHCPLPPTPRAPDTSLDALFAGYRKQALRRFEADQEDGHRVDGRLDRRIRAALSKTSEP